jgi:peptidyl-dipeptidase A
MGRTLIFVVMGLVACQPKPVFMHEKVSGMGPKALSPTAAGTVSKKVEPTVEMAQAFIQEVESELLRLWVDRERANWVKSTYISHDTEVIAAQADERVMEYVGRMAKASRRFDSLALPADIQRKILLLRLSLSLPAPSDPPQRAALARIASYLESTYGKGKYCPPRLKGKCLDLEQLSKIIAESRNYDELLDAWQGWRTISLPMRSKFSRYVELANEGARELGFANLGDLW